MSRLTIVIDQLYVDDGDDIQLVDNKLVGYLRKIHPERRRLVVYIATEPVTQEDGKEHSDGQEE